MQDTLYTGSVYALYAQVALFDAEGGDSYPEWETGTEDAVFGPRGIAVATAGDTEIEIVVRNDKKTSAVYSASRERFQLETRV
jgi:hypothetical protein